MKALALFLFSTFSLLAQNIPQELSLSAVTPHITINDEGDLRQTESVMFTFSLNSPAPAPITVSLIPVGGSADASEFNIPRPSVTIPRGGTYAMIMGTHFGDDEREETETAVYALKATYLDGTPVKVDQETILVTIIDDDQIELRINNDYVLESGSSKSLKITLSEEYERDLEVEVYFSGGMAEMDKDWSYLQPQKLTFLKGETVKYFEVSIIEDHIKEENEAAIFTISIDDPDIRITKEFGVLTIVDND